MSASQAESCGFESRFPLQAIERIEAETGLDSFVQDIPLFEDAIQKEARKPSDENSTAFFASVQERFGRAGFCAGRYWPRRRIARRAGLSINETAEG